MTWGLYGPMGLVSTAEDMAKFMKELFSGGLFVNAETLDLMLTDIATAHGNKIEHMYHDRCPSNYYMGIEQTQIEEIETYGHTGYWGSLMVYIPKSEISIGLFILNADAVDGTEWKLLRKQ